jgi:ribulose-phosphate 3-epimerase
MKPQFRLAPSILSANFTDLATDIAIVEKAGAQILHLDIMDGHFVPNLTFGPPVVEQIRKITHMTLDCHLMVTNPEFMVPLFAAAGADIITVHAETTHHLDRLVHQIQELGCSAGVAINPGTPLSAIENVIDFCDMVLIMSVNPGFGGQKFIPYTLQKITQLRHRVPHLDIQVDGGIKLDNIDSVIQAGATNFVAGSAIFGAKDVQKATLEFLEKFRAS